MRLKLVTYNIHRCIGTDRQHIPARINSVLREIRPDIVALQEVEYIQTLDELGFMTENPGFRKVVGPTMSRQKSRYGNALLSRYPILAERKINLSCPGQEKRGAIDVDINCNGHIIRVIATHLGLAPVERRQQTKKLLAMIGNPVFNQPITILMGDMNEWFLWGRPLRWIHEYFGRTREPATFPARLPLFSLDRIWVHPAGILKEVARHNSRLASVASDHLPLTAVIDL
jgi:endonuclease/exonuclease/phosphatase family metal-dependent hydrolase